MPETLRSCMIAEEGYTFLSLDASQIELRVIAILSQDPQMLADLRTGDLHLASAIRIAQLKGEDLDWVDNPDKIEEKKKRRYDAKQCNFAVIYGAQEFQLSTMLECSTEDALQFMTDHKAAYPRPYEWMEGQITLAKENGYVQNIFGRIRPLPELQSGQWRIREKAEKEVVNTIVQGMAVDIVKLAMLYLRRLFDKDIRLVLQVHDEILWECPDGLLLQALEQCKELEKAFPDYPFDIKTGKVYGSMS